MNPRTIKVGQTIFVKSPGTGEMLIKVTEITKDGVVGFDPIINRSNLFCHFNTMWAAGYQTLLEANQYFVDPKKITPQGYQVSDEDLIKLCKVLHPDAIDVRMHENGQLVVTHMKNKSIVVSIDEHDYATIDFINDRGQPLEFSSSKRDLVFSSEEVDSIVKHLTS